MTPHLYVILANLTLYIAFYVILNIYIYIYCILMVDVSHIGFEGKEGCILMVDVSHIGFGGKEGAILKQV